MHGTTYSVRIYKTEIYRGREVTTYWVRWKVDSQFLREPFRNAAQADSFRSSLLTAARSGEAFSIETGQPVSWKRAQPSTSWYKLATEYAAMKWRYASPNHRRGIAEALTDATEAMLASEENPYTRDQIRQVLRTWAFSDGLRGNIQPPEDIAAILRWLETATIPVADLTRPQTGAVQTRALLDRISKKKDGTLAAPNTANRKRMVIGNALEYAVENSVLPNNPVRRISWRKPRILKTVDPSVVINAGQAQRLLAAVHSEGGWGKRLVAFFACMYYAALRPEEVIDLRRANLVSLPDQGWGEMRLTHSQPRSGARWTDGGKSRERRELKHRAVGETRTVPLHPQLVQLLREHIDTFPAGPNGRVFNGPRRGAVAEWVYLDVFHKARGVAFTAEEAASPLAEIPYALRHAAVSTWLNAGVAPPQVAEWAGHSVDVLLRVYAKCIHGQQDQAKRRILEATQPDQLSEQSSAGCPDDNPGQE